MHDRKEYVIHIANLRQVLNHVLVSKKVHRAIKFNQKSCLKPYIDMNTKLRKKANYDFEKYFFNFMNNSVFRRNMKNVRKHKDFKIKRGN